MNDFFSIFDSKTRSREHFLQTENNTVKFGENSLRVFGPIVWNRMLPEDIKTCPTLEDFKDKMDSWVPANCPCKLCKIYVKNVGYIDYVE